MIERWDVKNVDGIFSVFIQGGAADAKLLSKKLAGFSRPPSPTNMPPYNFRLELLSDSEETLEKIKTAVEEAARQSKKIEPFTPATLENAAADSIEGTVFTLKKDAAGPVSAGDSSDDKIDVFDLNFDDVPGAVLEQTRTLDPVKPEEPVKENFEVPGTPAGGKDLNIEEKEVPPVPVPPTESADIKPQIDAVLTKLYPPKEDGAADKTPRGIEDILAARTALDVYADIGGTEKKTETPFSKEEEEEISKILEANPKTSFNIFEQEIRKHEEAVGHAVDPFDLILPKNEEVKEESSKIIKPKKAGKKTEKNKPAPAKPPEQKTPAAAPEQKPEPSPAPEPAKPAEPEKKQNLKPAPRPPQGDKIILDPAKLTAAPEPFPPEEPLKRETTNPGIMPVLKINIPRREPEARKKEESFTLSPSEVEEEIVKDGEFTLEKIESPQEPPAPERDGNAASKNPFDDLEAAAGESFAAPVLPSVHDEIEETDLNEVTASSAVAEDAAVISKNLPPPAAEENNGEVDIMENNKDLKQENASMEAVKKETEAAPKAPPPPPVTMTKFSMPAAPAKTSAPAAKAPVPPPPTQLDITLSKTKTDNVCLRRPVGIDHSIELVDMEKHNWPLEIPLVPTFTFESMVIGANRFAHATAISVIENPGSLYNPLVLHGGTGTGKTHFLNAIGYALSKKFGQQNIFMTNGVRFSRGIQRYVVEGKIEQFEEFIDKVQALLIDDIHLTAVNEQNREYISKYLGMFLKNKKQIVITSKYPPESLAKLEELINFKLDAGWISELKTASGDNRKKIVRKMLTDNEVGISDQEAEKFFKDMSLSAVSRTVKRVKVLANVLESDTGSAPSYEALLEKMLPVAGEDMQSAVTVKDFSQVTQLPNFGRGEWGKIGFFYPQDNANMMKWMAYCTGERARELGIKGSYEFALKSSYNPANIISSAFKIANICDNKKLKGAVILGPSGDLCDSSVRENFYDILTHMLEIMLIRCGVVDFEKIKAPSIYVKVIAELLK